MTQEERIILYLHNEYGEGNDNVKIVIAALEKRIPKKPIFYDTKFRQRGVKYGELVTIERAYNCPHCNCTVWEKDKRRHCDNCGQALDWSDLPTEKGGGEE